MSFVVLAASSTLPLVLAFLNVHSGLILWTYGICNAIYFIMGSKTMRLGLLARRQYYRLGDCFEYNQMRTGIVMPDKNLHQALIALGVLWMAPAILLIPLMVLRIAA
jgi:hypothetical protein